MKNFKPLTVLVIESSLLLIDQLKPGYTQIFEISGYNPVFFGATSEKDARDVIDREWPHIIICDMTLSQGGADGLIIVQHLKQDFPDIFLILASKQAYSIRSVFAKKAFFDMFFDKTEINAGNRTYFDIYSQQLRERFQVNTHIDIDDDASGYKKDFKASELREFNSLLAQITFTGHDSDAMITPDTARIDKLTGGFSGSKVYRFTTFNRSSKLESVTAVLKVSTRYYAQIELQNYNKFVKWGLPYTWRVDVLGCGFTKKYGAIAYSFVHGDVGSKINSLSFYLENGNYDVCHEVINKIFSPNMKRWYGDELIEEKANIISHYSNRYFRGPDNKNTSAKAFQEICASEYRTLVSGAEFSISGRQISEPLAKLFGQPMNGFLSCICHGDLNSNNVIISESHEVIFIDFQETARGHVFEDFVTMEASVRLNGGKEKQLNSADYLESEFSVASGSCKPELKSLILIDEIRKLAFSNFPHEPRRNYYYSSAVFHFRLLRIKELTNYQRIKCVSTIIASLHQLD